MGKCRPLLNSLPGIITFKVWLMTGGCGTFAPAYLRMVKSCRANRGRGAQQSVINSYQVPAGGKTAYIDPNDPSVIYLQQPAIAQNINYNPWGQYQPIPQNEPMQIHPNQMPPQQPNYQPPQNNYQPVPQQPNYQPPPNNYQPVPQQPNYQPPPQNYQPVPQQPNYMPPPQNYQPMPPPQQPNYQQGPPNNNYPSFDQYNQQGANDLPTEQELYNSQNPNYNNHQPPAYPNQGMGGLNNVINDQQQQQGGGKYFGFWGPNLDRNQNNNNNGYGQ